MTQPDSPRRTTWDAYWIRQAARARLGWTSRLLLLALAGCQVPSHALDRPPTIATVAAETSVLCCSSRAASDPLCSTTLSNGDALEANPRFEKTQPVRLVSLDSELPADAMSALTLEDAITMSLARNPDLVAVRASGPVAHAAYHVAETYPWNPQFQTQVLPYSRDRKGEDGAVSQQHVIVQTFELGKQRRFRVGAAVASALENVRLAKAMRRPDLQIGPMWQRDDNIVQFWGFQAQMDIPIVNTGVPLVEQRMAELRQQQITATQLENRAILEGSTAILRYERARRLVEQSRGELEPTLLDALEPFDHQFRAGQITLLQVFAGRAAVAQSRQSFLQLWNELALAAADVTQATGLPPQQLLADNPLPLGRLEEVPRP